jgi:ERCC4-type nuclease
VPLLEAAGATVDMTELDSADFAIVGAGHTLGVELKTIGDLLRCIHDGRFAGSQLPAMRSTYERCALIVQGAYRRGEEGALEMPHGNYWATPQWARTTDWARFEGWQMTMQLLAGLPIIRRQSERETVEWLVRVDQWVARWDEHASHEAWDTSYGQELWAEPGKGPTRLALMLKEIPGFETKRAIAAALHFKTMRAAANAEPLDWTEIKGVGKKLALAAWKALNEEEKR